MQVQIRLQEDSLKEFIASAFNSMDPSLFAMEVTSDSVVALQARVSEGGVVEFLDVFLETEDMG